MTFERFERPTVRLADFVYDQILHAVVSGGLKPGRRLVQEVLAEEMAVSRTPVREALLRLEAEGILESADRGGFLVRSFDPDEVRDSYQLRAAVEGYAARVAAERQDPKALASIRRAIAGSVDGGSSPHEGFEMNRRIHRSVVEAAGNPLFLEAFDSVWSRSQAFRWFAEMHLADLHFLHADPDHHDVMAAIESGDVVAAQEAMMAHVLSGLELQLDVLAGAGAPEATEGDE